jgi:Cu/Ag efflux protein CusF
MKLTAPALVAATVAAIALGGCGESPDGKAASGGASPATPATPAMPAMQQAAPAAAEHMAEGTLNSVDTTAGTVSISHGPVASASWPAMTMSFKLADPSAAATLKPGEHVKFQFTIQSGMSATVTQISSE